MVAVADAYAAIGVRFHAAWTRLIAAERAEPCLRRCDAVLAASA